MKCKGYNRDVHETLQIHAKGLCPTCYQKQWRHEHREQIIKYQKEYRAGKEYREMNRIYAEKYRKTQKIKDSNS